MLWEHLAFSVQDAGYLRPLSTTSKQIGTDFRFWCFQACSSSTASSIPSDMMSKSPSAGATCSNRHRCALLEDQVRFLYLLGAQLLLATKPPGICNSTSVHRGPMSRFIRLPCRAIREGFTAGMWVSLKTTKKGLHLAGVMQVPSPHSSSHNILWPFQRNKAMCN